MHRKISLGTVAAVVFWALTVLFILVGTVTSLTTDTDRGFAVAMSFMAHGLACSAAAATVTIRNGLQYQNDLVDNAFELGRDSRQIRRLGQ